MKIYTTVLCILLLFCTSINGFCQRGLASNNLNAVDIDKISDGEVVGYYQKAIDAGLNETQVYDLAKSKGLPDAQLDKLKQRVALLGLSSSKSSTPLPVDSGISSTTSRFTNFTQENSSKKPVNIGIFGADLFSTTSNVFEPNLRIATPVGYILGPDDEIIVNVYGFSEKNYRLKVNAEGNVYIENVGPINVMGLTIEDATLKIKAKLAATIYNAILSGQTKVMLSLGNIRSIHISVIGMVSKPGNYVVSSLSTVFNVLYLCGGPSAEGSYRNIEIIRGNKVIRKVDLYRFLMVGDKSDNILLQEQDVIRIPYYEKRVTLIGEARRNAIFELKPTEQFKELIHFGGGFTDSAFKGSIKVTRLNDDGRQILDIPADTYLSFQPKSGDIFSIGKAPERFTNRVIIRGAVLRPGEYELKPDMQLKDLINKAGGLRPDAFGGRGIIARLAANFALENVSFSPLSILNGDSSVSLVRDDEVLISSIFDLQDQASVTISGEVRKPGNFTFRSNSTFKDILFLSGGFTESADSGSVEINRRIRNPNVDKDDFLQTQVIKLAIYKNGSNSLLDQPLMPYDLIVVRPKGNFEPQRSVVLKGEIMSPGIYVLSSRKESISSLLQRSGGFKAGADSNSITIRRVLIQGLSMDEKQDILGRLLSINRDSILNNASLRTKYFKNIDFLSVDVNKVKSNPGSNDDLILEDGDQIEVSRASSLVRVSGEVYHPSSFPFEGSSNAKTYIQRSGNYTPNAKKGSVFVIYPDGKAKSVKHFLFFKSYPTVTPRSEIFVPSKNKENRRTMSTGEWVAISSIIATMATLAVTIINTK